MIFPKRFIKATEEFSTFENWVPAPYFRKKITVSKQTPAEILITACGFYELYINGERITKGCFAPYISNPDDMLYYDKYTVSLRKGENVIAVQLGNGFQNNPGGYIWDFDTADFRSAPSFALSCRFTDENGKETVYESGKDFKTAPSPIIFDDYRFGEYYDANKTLDGWNLPEFDDSEWQEPLIAATPAGEARICEAEPIVSHGEIKPVDIIRAGDSYIYDFGICAAGVCRLTIDGDKGQKITLRYADQLIDGDLDIASDWFVRDFWERDKHIVHKDVYICGGGTESYTPAFTYHGFRYVKVSGITAEQATDELLTCVVLYSDIKPCGGFSTSHKTARALQDMTVRSDISNFHYFPTDCPHREKNGWTIDAALSAEQFLLNLTVEASFKEWMRNMVKSQKSDGRLTGIVPTSGWGYDWGNGPESDRAIVYIPYFTYIYRGDTQMILDTADSIERYLKYLNSQTADNGLISIGLGDWCHVGREADDPKAPLVVVDSLVCLNIANMAAALFDAVDLKDKKAYAARLAEGYKAAVRKQLIDFKTFTVCGDCQTSQALAIAYGVFEEDEKAEAFARLLEMIERENNHLDVGVIGNRVLFEVLFEFGYGDLAFHMITRPDFPSYGNWIERGATSLWEKMVREERDYSKNHHFWGCVSAWFIKYLAGIRYNPAGNNLKEVNIAPNFVKALPNASAYFVSNYGKIESSWKREGEVIKLSLTVPNEFTGSIILPSGYTFDDKTRKKAAASGEYTVIKEI